MLLLWLTLAAEAAPIDFAAAVRAAVDGPPGAEIVEAERALAFGESYSNVAFQNPSVEIERVEETELRVTIPVPLSGAPIARMAAGGADRKAADHRYDRDRAELACDVGLAYLTAMAAEERATLAALSLSDAERVREAAARLHAAGEISDLDRSVTEAVAAGALADAARAEQDAIIARMRLEVWLGRAPTGELDPEDWPVIDSPGALDAADLPATRAEAEEARAARARRTAAVLDRVPTPGLIVGSHGGHAPIYGVTFEVPLLSPGAGQVRAATSAARIADADAEIALLDAAAAIEAARRRVTAAERGWEAISAVSGLDRALADVTAAIALGEFSTLDFTSRRAPILDAMERRIEARYQLESARLDLWRLAGRIPTEAP